MDLSSVVMMMMMTAAIRCGFRRPLLLLPRFLQLPIFARQFGGGRPKEGPHVAFQRGVFLLQSLDPVLQFQHLIRERFGMVLFLPIIAGAAPGWWRRLWFGRRRGCGRELNVVVKIVTCTVVFAGHDDDCGLRKSVLSLSLSLCCTSARVAPRSSTLLIPPPSFCMFVAFILQYRMRVMRWCAVAVRKILASKILERRFIFSDPAAC